VVCGDAWAIEARDNRTTLMVADGLGHGPDAARASRAATVSMLANLKEEPGELLKRGHQALQATRGAAVSVARFGVSSDQGIYAGVGNIAGRVESSNERRQLVSHNGTLGHALRKVQEFPFSLAPGGLLILHSDGLSGHWTLADYPGLMAKHAGLIAGVLYRDHDRGRDDTTIVVIKKGSGP
jgi:serine/threonine protein phosphatase PrpC